MKLTFALGMAMVALGVAWATGSPAVLIVTGVVIALADRIVFR